MHNTSGIMQSQVGRSSPAVTPQARAHRAGWRSLVGNARSYEQPTVSSTSRSPSPYTKRRMCELSEDARQRLAHLNLGPYEFKKETDDKPPFVVRHIGRSSSTCDTPVCSCSPKENTWDIRSRIDSDPSLLGNYRPKKPKIMSAPPEGDLDVSSFAEHLISEPAGRQFRSAGLLMTRPVQKGSQTPAPSRCSLRERFQPDPNAPTNWEEIHERVRRILQTHSARQRLTFDESIPRGKDQEKQNSAAPREDSLGGTELHNRPPFHHNPSVHLDNGEYWSNRAALYKGKSHRAIFEESLEKIYRNMYKTAVSTLASRRKPQH
ncbi:spermatogenesis-associated protein 6 isoform X1 [Rhinatrema bivittatum]|uniref:spermatogenesis-associated protein 6 isoform X1 n=1 Tax=Rhinatrema bivittatum TaxID=194408 RepID=UPI00112E1448|nr:spermatogenesis-associated protein 6 isoform X1 [Rhinatrema bivittatum]XP_029474510.1 spermatogenesis-associated protein 6 isoform X1 [Rhinatrema bivittatum]